MLRDLIQKAEQGSTDAQYELGRLYRSEQLYKYAFRWFLKAAKQGHPDAQYNLAVGYGEEGNIQEAIKWYKLAVEQGNANAAFNLGTFYYEGVQVKQDYALDLQEAYDFSEDETKELQQQQITMHTESKDIVEPQQTSARARLYYYSGYYYMTGGKCTFSTEPLLGSHRQFTPATLAEWLFAGRHPYIQDHSMTAHQETGFSKPSAVARSCMRSIRESRSG